MLTSDISWVICMMTRGYVVKGLTTAILIILKICLSHQYQRTVVYQIEVHSHALQKDYTAVGEAKKPPRKKEA